MRGVCAAGGQPPVTARWGGIIALPRLGHVARHLGRLLILVTCLTHALTHAPGMAHAQERPPPVSGLKQINVGFVRHAYGTWTARIADGGFDTATGRSLRWFPHDTDSTLMAALASGRLDVGLVGTGVLAAALARGLDLRVFYTLGASAESEGLVMAADAVFRFAEPRSLQSKVIAVPYGSAAHLRLLENLRRWSLSVSSMRIVNLQTSQIAQAWQRKEIDAAVVSEPLLGHLAQRGRLIPLPPTGKQGGTLVYIAAADFIAQHIVFLSRFVDIMARADAAFADSTGPLDETRAEVRSIAFMTGLTPTEVIASIGRYQPPALPEQVSSRWLGGGAESALLAEIRSNNDTWRWGGRLTGPDPDLSTVLAPEPVEMALSYRK